MFIEMSTLKSDNIIILNKVVSFKKKDAEAYFPQFGICALIVQYIYSHLDAVTKADTGAAMSKALG